MFLGVALCLVFAISKPLGLTAGFVAVVAASQRLVALLHSFSTTYLVVASPVFAPLRQKNRATFQTIPILIFLGCLILGLLVAKVAMPNDDHTLDWAGSLYYVYIGIFMIGHFWHFGRQDFGVLSLYRHRTGQFSSRDRNLDLRFTQFMMYLVQPIVYTNIFFHFPFSYMFRWFAHPDTVHWMAGVAIGLAIGFYLLMMVVEIRKANRSIPKLLYYTVILFHPTFLYFASFGLMVPWYLAYLWSHWLIAIYLAGRVGVGGMKARGATAVWAFGGHILAILGIALIVWLGTQPVAQYGLLGKDWVDAREMLRTLPTDVYTVVGLFLGFALGEQVVHYYCDRQLFKMQDADVRVVVAPHL